MSTRPVIVSGAQASMTRAVCAPSERVMNPHLFVYGTLLSTAGHPKGARLQREAGLIGAASMPGRLYRIKHYPGLVEGTDPNELVHGEVYALNNPTSALTWLDAY